MKKIVSRLLILRAEKEIRDKRNYSQLDISAATGLAQGQISRLMRGRQSIDGITVGSARKLADFFGVGVDDLFEEVEDEQAS